MSDPCQLLFIPCDTVGSNTLIHTLFLPQWVRTHSVSRRGSNTHTDPYTLYPTLLDSCSSHSDAAVGSTHSLSHRAVGSTHSLSHRAVGSTHSLSHRAVGSTHSLSHRAVGSTHSLSHRAVGSTHSLSHRAVGSTHSLSHRAVGSTHSLSHRAVGSTRSLSHSVGQLLFTLTQRTDLSFNRESNEQKQFLQRPMTHESKDTIPLLFIKRQVLTHNQFSPCSLEAMFFGGLCYLDKINAGCKTTACNESKQTNRRQTGEEEGNT